MIRQKNRNILIFCGFLLYSLAIMLLCTKSSPLYKLNDWYDANAYFTMGKGLMNGLVPYRDLFDHKGPLLYLIYGIGYLIDRTGFFGVFVLQTVSMSLVLLFSYKTARYYTNTEKSAVIIAILVPLFTLSSNIYAAGGNYGGGAPEEFLLPIFAVSLYTLIKLVKETDGQAAMTFVIKNMFLLGILTGCILLIKFTYVVFSIGLLLPFLIEKLIKSRKVFFVSLLFLFFGCTAVFLPYTIYALITRSGTEFIDVYVKFNQLYGITKDATLIHVFTVGFSNAVSFLSSNLLIGILTIFGIMSFTFFEKENIVISLSILLSFIFVITLCSVVVFNYVYIPITFYCLFGYVSLYKIGLRLSAGSRSKAENEKSLGIIAAAVIFAFTVGNNALISYPLNKLNVKKPAQSCQQKVADIILSDSKENRTLLEVNSLDGGFYTASGIVPASRYFYRPNIAYDIYPDILNRQLADVDSSVNAYVISPDKASYNGSIESEPANIGNIGGKIGNAIAENYKLVAVIPGTYLQSGQTFYLYKALDRV